MQFAKLSELELDAITELLNMGIGQAASALSLMVDEEVHLIVPEVEFLSWPELKKKIQQYGKQRLAAVTQKFIGEYNGNALLLFSEESARSVVRLLLKDTLSKAEITCMEEEALTEVGNIILNACFGSLANVLNCGVSSDLPRYESGDYSRLIRSLSDGVESDCVMLLKMKFTIVSSQIEGYISFVMDFESMEIFRSKVKSYIDSFQVKVSSR